MPLRGTSMQRCALLDWSVRLRGAYPNYAPRTPHVIAFHAVTPERLGDLQRFSAAHGKFRCCSCMRWRLTSREYRRSTKETRVEALDNLVRQCVPVGVLAYDGDTPSGK